MRRSATVSAARSVASHFGLVPSFMTAGTFERDKFRLSDLSSQAPGSSLGVCPANRKAAIKLEARRIVPPKISNPRSCAHNHTNGNRRQRVHENQGHMALPKSLGDGEFNARSQCKRVRVFDVKHSSRLIGSCFA